MNILTLEYYDPSCKKCFPKELGHFTRSQQCRKENRQHFEVSETKFKEGKRNQIHWQIFA